MDRVKLIIYSVLAMLSMLFAGALYFLADNVYKFSQAWDSGADHYHNKVLERS